MLDFDGDFEIDAADVTAFWARASLRRGDLDGDGAVQASDLAVMLGAWAQPGATADLDLDGTVGASDLALLLGNWGA
jgi:hypothetical protein